MENEGRTEGRAADADSGCPLPRILPGGCYNPVDGRVIRDSGPRAADRGLVPALGMALGAPRRRFPGTSPNRPSPVAPSRAS